MFNSYTKFLPINNTDATVLIKHGAKVKRHNNEFYIDTDSAHKIVQETLIKAVIEYKDVEERVAGNIIKLNEQKNKIKELTSTLNSYSNTASEMNSKIKEKQKLIEEINLTKINSTYEEALKKIEDGEYQYVQKIIKLLNNHKKNINLKQKEAEAFLSNLVNNRKSNIDEKLNEEIRTYTRKQANIRPVA